MRGRPNWPVFIGLAATVAFVDQLTKSWVVSRIAPGERIEVLGDVVRLIHTQNSGAVFGLFRDNALLFGIASIVVVGLIVLYHARSPRSLLLSATLGLLLGGALGNLTDRFRLGHVVDFVDAGIGTLRFYTFNVADSAISLAILLLILIAIRPSLADGRPARDDRAVAEARPAAEPGPPAVGREGEG